MRIVFHPMFYIGAAPDSVSGVVPDPYDLSEAINRSVDLYGGVFLPSRGDTAAGYETVESLLVDSPTQLDVPYRAEDFKVSPYIPANGKILLSGGVPDNSITFRNSRHGTSLQRCTSSTHLGDTVLNTAF